jgi:hypothetical protein
MDKKHDDRMEPISIERTYTVDEFARICAGGETETISDCYALYEKPLLTIHRSDQVYRVRFSYGVSEFRISGASTSAYRETYTDDDALTDALLLAVILDDYAGRDTDPAWKAFEKGEWPV